jgi:hypothetical protein
VNTDGDQQASGQDYILNAGLSSYCLATEIVIAKLKFHVETRLFLNLADHYHNF